MRRNILPLGGSPGNLPGYCCSLTSIPQILGDFKWLAGWLAVPKMELDLEVHPLCRDSLSDQLLEFSRKEARSVPKGKEPWNSEQQAPGSKSPQAEDHREEAAVAQPEVHRKEAAVAQPEEVHRKEAAVAQPEEVHRREAAVAQPEEVHRKEAAVAQPEDHRKEAEVAQPEEVHKKEATVAQPEEGHRKEAEVAQPEEDHSKEAVIEENKDQDPKGIEDLQLERQGISHMGEPIGPSSEADSQPPVSVEPEPARSALLPSPPAQGEEATAQGPEATQDPPSPTPGPEDVLPNSDSKEEIERKKYVLMEGNIAEGRIWEEEKEKKKKKKTEEKPVSKLRSRSCSSKPRTLKKKAFPRTSRSQVLSNLYLTLYNEVQNEKEMGSANLEGIQKASKIFRAFQNGKMNVNELTEMLCIMGISLNEADMTQALESVVICENGLLEFSNFLEVLNNDPKFLQDQAFRDVFHTFQKIKGGRIKAASLPPVLTTLGIFEGFEKYREALSRVPMADDGTLDVADFMLSVRGPLYPNEGLAELRPHGNTEKLLCNETKGVIKTAKKGQREGRGSQSLQKMSSLSSKQADAPGFWQHGKKSYPLSREASGLESRRVSVRCSTTLKKHTDRKDSSDLESCRPSRRSISSNKKHLDEVDICDLESWQQSLRTDLSLRSDQFTADTRDQESHRQSIPVPENNKDFPVKSNLYWLEALKDYLGIISTNKENFVSVHQLQSTLAVLGIDITEEELQEALKRTTRDGHNMVNFIDFIIALANIRRLAQFSVVKDTISALDKIEGEDVAVGNLLVCLKNLGLYLSPTEFEETLKMVSVDENGKVNFKKFIEILMKNSQRFSEMLAIPGIVKNISSMREDKIDAQDLWNILIKFNSNLNEEDFQATLIVDGDGKVDFEEFLANMEQLSKLQEPSVQGILMALGLIKEDMVSLQDVDFCLRCFGLHLTQPKLEELLHSLCILENRTVNIKELLAKLRGTRDFSNFTALCEIPNTAGSVPESLTETRESESSGPFDALQEGVKIIKRVKDGKINIEDLKVALTKMNINLTKEEFEEALVSCALDDNGNVDWKDFTQKVTSLKRFSQSVALQLAFTGLGHLQHGHIDIAQLKASLLGLGLHEATASLRELLQDAMVDEDDGKLDLLQFMTVLSKVSVIPEATEMRAVSSTFTIASGDQNLVVDELEEALGTLGIHLTNEEVKEMVNTAPVNEDGTLNFKGFVKHLSNTQKFRDCQQIQNAWTIINKVRDGKVKTEELPPVLLSMGIQLNDEELKDCLTSVTAGGGTKVELRDVVDILTGPDTPLASKFLDLQEAALAVNKIREDKMPVSAVKANLDSLEVSLPDKTIQEALRTANVYENGDVSFQEFLEGLSCSHPITELEVLQNSLDSISLIKDVKIPVAELEASVENLKLSLKNEDLREASKMVAVDEEGHVYLKEVFLALNSIQRLSDPGVLLEAIKAYNKIPGAQLNVDELKSVLECLGVCLKEEDFLEALRMVPDDKAGKYNLKEFMSALLNTKIFENCSGLEDALYTFAYQKTDSSSKESTKCISPLETQLIKAKDSEVLVNVPLEGGEVDVGHLDTTLDGTGILQSIEEELKVVPKQVSENEDEKLSEKESMECEIGGRGASPAEREEMEELKTLMRTGGEMGKESVPGGDEKSSYKEFLESKFSKKSVIITDRVEVIEPKATIDSLEDIGRELISGEIEPMSEEEFMESEVCERKVSPTEKIEPMSEEEFMESEVCERKMSPTEKDEKQSENESMEGENSEKMGSPAESDKVDILHLGTALSNVGMTFTDQELQEVVTHLLPDAEGMVSLNEAINVLKHIHKMSTSTRHGSVDLKKLTGAVRALRKKSVAEGEMGEVKDLNTVLGNLHIVLTNKTVQREQLSTPADDQELEDTDQGVEFAKDEQEMSDTEEKEHKMEQLKAIFRDTGLYLPPEAFQEASEIAKYDENGNLNFIDLICKLIKSQAVTVEGKMVKQQNLSSILKNIGVNLSSEQLEEVLQHAPVDEFGEVNIRKFMDILYSISEPQSSQSGETLVSNDWLYKPVAKPKLPPLVKLPSICRIRGYEFTRVLQGKSRCKGMKTLTRSQLEAFQNAYDFFDKDSEGTIGVQGLETSVKRLGISLTNQEVTDELKCADVDRDGKVNFSDFLTVLTDKKRFIQAIAPDKDNSPGTSYINRTGILLFEVLSKLVELSALPRKSLVEIVCYYRDKYRRVTSKLAEKSGQGHLRKKKTSKAPKPPREGPQRCHHSTYFSMSRITRMTSQELSKFLDNLKNQSLPSKSPYAKIPIFPLTPNNDKMIPGKPIKDLRKLELQRKKEPLTCFEDYFFRKRNWMAKLSALKRSESSSADNHPEMGRKIRRLMIENSDMAREQMKKAQEIFHMGVAFEHRKEMLKLWHQLHGDQIGLETGNEAFYHTFSKYTWSWNISQELLSYKDLKLFDAQMKEFPSSTLLSLANTVEHEMGRGSGVKSKGTVRPKSRDAKDATRS
ncbi:EF-hand calcium-binding domain-containing protein 3 [Tachyglossus aculeatus]|uniref:EF-hand calcium-binding domain-containing protein 3 n=1 Tax=Tachyglossus aculeatus TaxID=9261 RepID=UPI0018F3D9FE|nr:EF-hand calcium-binding domain-containing protein 3 [Tachyglossus aculeatus]